MFEIALYGGPAAAGPDAGGVPDLGQVPELDAGIVALGLVPVVTLAGGDRVERGQEILLSAGPGVQQPGAVSAGRPQLVRGGEGEPRPVPRPGRAAFLPVPAPTLGFGPGAAVAALRGTFR